MLSGLVVLLPDPEVPEPEVPDEEPPLGVSLDELPPELLPLLPDSRPEDVLPSVPDVPALPVYSSLLDFFLVFDDFFCCLVLSSPDASIPVPLWPDMLSAFLSTSAAREGLVLSLTPSLSEV